MTAQTADIIYINGQQNRLYSLPLYGFNRDGNRKFELNFLATCTANDRGYVATWEISLQNMLYLIDIEGQLEDGSQVTVKTLFPDAQGKVLADWFSGVLKIPQGELLEYVHFGFESIFERTWIIRVDRGKVTDQVIKVNKQL